MGARFVDKVLDFSFAELRRLSERCDRLDLDFALGVHRKVFGTRCVDGLGEEGDSHSGGLGICWRGFEVVLRMSVMMCAQML